MSGPIREPIDPAPAGPISRPRVRSIEEAEYHIGILHYRSITDGDRLMLADLRLRRLTTPWWRFGARRNLDQWIEVARATINSRNPPTKPPADR